MLFGDDASWIWLFAVAGSFKMALAPYQPTKKSYLNASNDGGFCSHGRHPVC